MGKKLTVPFIVLAGFLLQPNFGELSPESFQEQKVKEKSALQYEVMVVLKLVQVFVTDTKGNPVTDLTKDDFILYDNGEPKTITDFEKHLIQRPVRRVAPEKKPEERIAETQLPPSLVAESRMNRKFFFIFSSPNLPRSKKAAYHFLETQIQPTDEVGVISYSWMSGFTIHEYLTSDMEKVRRAIKGVKDAWEGTSGGSGMSLETERARAEEESGQPDRFSLSYLSTYEGPERESQVFTSNLWIDSFRELAKSLRYIPGYKNIILFSGGIPRSFLFGASQTLREKYQDMGKEFASANSPVHTVSTVGPGRVQSLEMLAELSGGEYFHSVNYYEKIANQIQDVTSNYYVLGYYIDETWDGKYHTIEVKVKRKGCEVHAQSGYFNPKPFTELDDFEKDLRLVDLALSEKPIFQEPLSFPSIALPCSGREDSNLVLLTEVSVPDIEEAATGKAELATFIFDQENIIISSIKGEIDFSSLPQKRIYLYDISSLKPGQYECRVVIRDTKTGRAARAASSVEIPEPVESGIKLYPPLLIVPEKKSFYLNLITVDKKKKKEASLSIADIYPFISNEHSPLVGDLEQGTTKLLAVIRNDVVNLKNPEIELTAYLFDYSVTQKTPLSFSILASEKREETDVLLVELHLPDLEPGQYFLKIAAEDVVSKSKSEVNQAFRLK